MTDSTSCLLWVPTFAINAASVVCLMANGICQFAVTVYLGQHLLLGIALIGVAPISGVSGLVDSFDFLYIIVGGVNAGAR